MEQTMTLFFPLAVRRKDIHTYRVLLLGGKIYIPKGVQQKNRLKGEENFLILLSLQVSADLVAPRHRLALAL